MANKTGYNEEELIEIKGASIKLLPEEREVILVMNDRERKWEASVSSPTYMKKFERQGWKCVRTEYYRDGEVCTKFFEAPSEKSISVGKYERPKRQMSEEQIRKMQEGKKKKKTSLRDLK